MASITDSSLFDILKESNTTVKNVLEHRDFVCLLKVGKLEIINYLLVDVNFRELYNILFYTTEDTEENRKIVQSCFLSLTSNNKLIQDKIKTNQELAAIFAEFMDKDESLGEKKSGYFSTLYISSLYVKNKRVLDSLSRCAYFCASHLSILAYRNLFDYIMTEYPVYIQSLEALIKFWFQHAGESPGFCISSIVLHCLMSSDKYYDLFDKEDLIDELFKAFHRESNMFFASELLKVIYMIFRQSKRNGVLKLVEKEGKEFNFQKYEENDLVLARAILLFNTYPSHLLRKLFAINSLSALGYSIVVVTREFSTKQLTDIINSENLYEKLQEWFYKTKSSFAIPELANILYGKYRDLPQNPIWKEFCVNTLIPHIKNRGPIKIEDHHKRSQIPPSEESSDMLSSHTIQLLYNPSDTSSSDDSIDEEKDPGGFENAKYFAKTSGMDNLFKELEIQQQKFNISRGGSLY